MDIQKDIEVARQILKKYNGKKLILFGSYADGSAVEYNRVSGQFPDSKAPAYFRIPNE
ncbi:MAG: hypothetical protein NT166_27980 [Candidatus Aminicenantes bacterium]|nr:hypothetical protein [Candidatus Aminicenantes bacterium]